jgi:hypothetical protein
MRSRLWAFLILVRRLQGRRGAALSRSNAVGSGCADASQVQPSAHGYRDLDARSASPLAVPHRPGLAGGIPSAAPFRRRRGQDRNRCQLVVAGPRKIATSVRPRHPELGAANRQLTAVAILECAGTTSSHLSRSSRRPGRPAPPGAHRRALAGGIPSAASVQGRNRCEIAAASLAKIATSMRPRHPGRGAANRQLTAVAIFTPPAPPGRLTSPGPPRTDRSASPRPGRRDHAPASVQDRNRCEIAAAGPAKIATSVRPGRPGLGAANRQLTAVAILECAGTTSSHLSRSSRRPHRLAGGIQGWSGGVQGRSGGVQGRSSGVQRRRPNAATPVAAALRAGRWTELLDDVTGWDAVPDRGAPRRSERHIAPRSALKSD